MARLRNRPPLWFWILAALIMAWALVGIYAFQIDATMTVASARAGGYNDYQVHLLETRPGWFLLVYAVAVFAAAFGAIALLLRLAHARWLLIVSLVAMVAQFVWLFAVTRLIAVEGFWLAAGFPIFLTLVGVAEVWFANLARKRAWIA